MLNIKKHLAICSKSVSFVVGNEASARRGVDTREEIYGTKKSDKHLTEVICLSPIKRKEVVVVGR